MDQVGRVDLLVPVVAGVEIEHPGDEGALEAGTVAAEEVEAGAGDLDSALEVDDAEVLGDLPVRLGGEVEGALGAVLGDDDVAGLVGGYRHVGQWHVGDVEHEVVEAGVDGLHLFVEGGDAIPEFAHGKDELLALGGVLRLANVFGSGVELGFEGLDLGEQSAATFIGSEDVVDRGVGVGGGDGGLDAVRFFADESEIEHGRQSFGDARIGAR